MRKYQVTYLLMGKKRCLEFNGHFNAMSKVIGLEYVEHLLCLFMFCRHWSPDWVRAAHQARHSLCLVLSSHIHDHHIWFSSHFQQTLRSLFPTVYIYRYKYISMWNKVGCFHLWLRSYAYFSILHCVAEKHISREKSVNPSLFVKNSNMHKYVCRHTHAHTHTCKHTYC